MSRLFPRLLLGGAGLLLLVIGAAVLLKPVAFAAANGVELPTIPSALSEYRAPGGMLFVSSVFILLAAVRKDLTRAGLTLAALIYGSYGASRLVGVMLDGMPSDALTQAMIIELLVGSMCLAMLLSPNRNDAESGQR